MTTPATGKHLVRTMCPMNCHPTLCGMLVEVEDGQLLRVMGDKENPDSQGFLCIRGQASREIIGNPTRLLHPLVRSRRRGTWLRATWDEALDRIAERDPALNAFQLVLADRAMEAARRAEEEIRRGDYRGPLHGVPISLKDIIDLRENERRSSR